ncbi:hypothetical protein GJAV_G00170600 [Gymnothorax javanicus]|nr:hypothetical protein GJAV_G00170600 [Gymnothorax javanicus]
MAALQWRMNGAWVRLIFTAVLCTLAFHNGVLSDEQTDSNSPTLTVITVPPELLDILRGDGDPVVSPGADDSSDSTGATVVSTKEDASGGSVTHDPQQSFDVQTILDHKDVATPGDVTPESTGEGEPMGGIQCVDEDALKDKDVVKLELVTSSTCEETKAKLMELTKELCGRDCNIQIYQEDSSSHILISGDDVEADAKGMAEKLSSQGIKEKLGVVEANPKWGKHPQTVLVTLLLLGLLLAAGLIGGYILKNRRSQPAKGPRLEPQEKPSANGESPDGVKTENPPTNGHSAAKTADTEL